MKKALVVFSLLFVASAFASPDDLAYFQQFEYRVDVDNSDPDFPKQTLRFLMADGDVRFPLADGRQMGIQMDILLNHDGTYELYYKEMYFQPNNPMSFMPGRCAKRTGVWTVPETKLALGDIGVGDRAMNQSQNAVTLTFNQDILTPGIKGKEIMLNYGFANANPGEFFNMICFFPE